MAIVDTLKYQKFTTQFYDLFEYLFSCGGISISNHIRSAAADSYLIEGCTGIDLFGCIDLGHFLFNLQKNVEILNNPGLRNQIGEIRTLLNDAIELEFNNIPQSEGEVTGVSIFFPDPRTFASSRPELLQAFHMTIYSRWSNFVKQATENTSGKTCTTYQEKKASDEIFRKASISKILYSQQVSDVTKSVLFISGYKFEKDNGTGVLVLRETQPSLTPSCQKMLQTNSKFDENLFFVSQDGHESLVLAYETKIGKVTNLHEQVFMFQFTIANNKRLEHKKAYILHSLPGKESRLFIGSSDSFIPWTSKQKIELFPVVKILEFSPNGKLVDSQIASSTKSFFWSKEDQPIFSIRPLNSIQSDSFQPLIDQSPDPIYHIIGLLALTNTGDVFSSLYRTIGDEELLKDLCNQDAVCDRSCLPNTDPDCLLNPPCDHPISTLTSDTCLNNLCGDGALCISPSSYWFDSVPSDVFKISSGLVDVPELESFPIQTQKYECHCPSGTKM
eukprot:GHVP01041763.1.p1 GENE.GHVP01041763.1~~GHVP01041763.1.p1  ORF type:complete len:502 (+),score=78.02 GHVP01041763.1:2113-3618(+)